MIVESSQQESVCIDNQDDIKKEIENQDIKLESEGDNDVSLSKKGDMEHDLECNAEGKIPGKKLGQNDTE